MTYTIMREWNYCNQQSPTNEIFKTCVEGCTNLYKTFEITKRLARKTGFTLLFVVQQTIPIYNMDDT